MAVGCFSDITVLNPSDVTLTSLGFLIDCGREAFNPLSQPTTESTNLSSKSSLKAVIPFWHLVIVNIVSYDDPLNYPHPFVDCTNGFVHDAPVPRTQLVVESSPLSNKSSYVVGFPFQPLDVVSSPGTLSLDKELEVISFSSENLAPLSIKRSFFHNPLDSIGQSYKNVTLRKKKPPKYKNVSTYKKIELGYADEARFPNN